MPSLRSGGLGLKILDPDFRIISKERRVLVGTSMQKWVMKDEIAC